MKALLLCLALSPLLAHADHNDDVADRVDQSRERAEERFERMHDRQAQRHGIGYACTTRDAQGRAFTSPWLADSLADAQRSALNRCSLFWNKGCHLVKCGKQRY